MSCLRHCFDRSGTFLLEYGYVLPPEGVPTETLKIKPEGLGCRTNHVLENRPVVHRFTVLFEHVLLRLCISRSEQSVLLQRDSKRQGPLGAFALWLPSLAPVTASIQMQGADGS